MGKLFSFQGSIREKRSALRNRTWGLAFGASPFALHLYTTKHTTELSRVWGKIFSLFLVDGWKLNNDKGVRLKNLVVQQKIQN